VRRETRKIKRQCRETFVSRTEHDLHGHQINAYKNIQNLNRTEKDNTGQHITKKILYL
jgi:hypothetical protein